MPEDTTGTPGAIDFIRLLFHGTERPVYFSSLANDRAEPGQPGERNINTRDPDDVERFVARWDRRGRGTFFCVATIEGGKRAKEHAREIPALWTDIDYKGVDPAQDVTAGIARLRYPPSLIVLSGHGKHLYWLLKEPADAQADQRRVEAALRQLADMVAGDLQVCEVARLMRLPGTHNTKGGEQIPVTAIQTRAEPYRYTLEELEDWLAEAAPVLRRRTGVKSAGIDARATDDNPWLRAAKDLGYKPRVDVAARLEGMTYGGAGEAGIHATQLSVSAALLNAGQDLEEVVALLLGATAHAAGDLGARWDWRREEAALRRMCVTWLEKHPPNPRTNPEPEPPPRASMEQDDEAGGENVVDLGAARARRKTKAKAGTPPHIIVAEAFLRVLEDGGEAVMFTDKGAYRYTDRLWRLETDKGLKEWLDVGLERTARACRMDSTNRLTNEARGYIIRNPDLRREGVVFDAHGQVPTRSGLVHPVTGIVTAPAREHFATWRIECDYDPAAACPWWQTMLVDMFADRPFEIRDTYIALLQEILGLGMIDAKPKSLAKALVLWGPQDTGKSDVLEVMAGLFGGECNTTPLSALSGDHGLMGFLERRPWLLHEAFDQSVWHLSAVVKSIISGDQVNINVKSGPFLSRRVTAPILWATNHAPQFREATRAIVERMVIVQCQQAFSQAEPIGAAAEASRRSFDKPSSLVLATELPGVLAWAIEGLRRALARGSFVLPQEARDIAHEIRLDSNIVAEFVETCIMFSPGAMVSAADFQASFVSWWLENRGEDHGTPSGIAIGKALRALGEPRIAIDRELRTKTHRYYAGVHLNDAGRLHWRNTVTSNAYVFAGRKASTTSGDGSPNTDIPSDWLGKRAIDDMLQAHSRKSVTRDENLGHPNDQSEEERSGHQNGHDDGHQGETSTAVGEEEF